MEKVVRLKGVRSFSWWIVWKIIVLEFPTSGLAGAAGPSQSL